MEFRNIIELHQGSDCWLATYRGPHADAVISAFGVNTIPLPYTLAANRSDVFREVQRAHPDKLVVFCNAISCGCCSLGCCCVNHMDIPRGIRPCKCSVHSHTGLREYIRV